jgi:hypothetical protein
MAPLVDVTEQKRLNEAREAHIPWKKWGPYLSERQWGTVREDYSDDGNAWDYFTHDQARSRAYRWGEDGLGGLSDDKQRLCFALALWNERDPILKERLFGLTNSEANHGEDVKEYYFYVDSTPTHSYMKYLYKYPQREYPYLDLIETNRGRSREEFEYELLDTGAFGEDRYFDVFVEYAKEGPEDVLVRVTVHNRGPEAARLRVLPTLWFRNTWSWGDDDPKPSLREVGPGVVHATHHELGEYWLSCDGAPELLFTENESNASRLWGQPNASPYVKDAFHAYVVAGQGEAINPAKVGTKAAAHYVLDVPAGGSKTVRLRLSAAKIDKAFGTFDQIFKNRIADADEFYERISPQSLTADERLVHRQALAGMLWSKQYYYFDLDRWLQEHKNHPLLESASPGGRNTEWFHMLNADIISMPDKWEYPWYAAWDLAFHTVSLALGRLRFRQGAAAADAAQSLRAPQWADSRLRVELQRCESSGARLGHVEPLQERADPRPRGSAVPGTIVPGAHAEFQLVGQPKDPAGRNVFAGGFLGLDNIGVFDRSAQLPTGGSLEQADGTAWMAFYCQNMLEIALILTEYDPMYERSPTSSSSISCGSPTRWTASARSGRDVGRAGRILLRSAAAARRPGDALKVRLAGGALPLCASDGVRGDAASRLSEADGDDRPVQETPSRKVVSHVAPTGEGFVGYKGRRLCRSSTSRSWSACSPTCSTRTSFSGPRHSLAVAAITWTSRSCFTSE